MCGMSRRVRGSLLDRALLRKALQRSYGMRLAQRLAHVRDGHRHLYQQDRLDVSVTCSLNYNWLTRLALGRSIPSALEAFLILDIPLDPIFQFNPVDSTSPVPPPVELYHFASGFQAIEESRHAVFLHSVVVQVVRDSILPYQRSPLIESSKGTYRASDNHPT